jgi:uncharacterized protein YecT (DUF1311 family)
MRALSISLALYLSLGLAASAAPAQDIVNECWKDHSHLQMSKCVESKARKARVNLDNAENETRLVIQTKNDEPEYVKEMAEHFEVDEASFKRYRRDHCRFLWSLAAGGNGAADIEAACDAELNGDRVEQLKALASWLIR